MRRKRHRQTFVLADGRKISTSPQGPCKVLFETDSVQIIAVSPKRLGIVKEAFLGYPYMWGTAFGKEFHFRHSDIVFDGSDKPQRGDCLLRRRHSDGRVLELTTPIIRVGARG